MIFIDVCLFIVFGSGLKVLKGKLLYSVEAEVNTINLYFQVKEIRISLGVVFYWLVGDTRCCVLKS